MRKYATVSAIALCAALAQGAFAVEVLAQDAAADTTMESEATVAPVIVDESLVGKEVVAADTGEELGTVESVEVNAIEPSEVTIAAATGDKLVVSEDQLSMNAEGQLVAELAAGEDAGEPYSGDDPTGSITPAPEAEPEAETQSLPE